ncbi:MAG: TRAP transporter substrate-binding protein [Lachnospiraceae bacterium]|nr:TRAP transporter substrate-binding protein [Lachnospiraceae bacterium]
MKAWKKAAALVLALTLVLSLAACGGQSNQTTKASDPPITLTCAITMSEDSVYYKDLTTLQTELNKYTDSITLDIQAGGVLGGETEYIEGLEAGTIDVMIVSFSPLAATSKKCGLFEIPYLIDDYDHLQKVWDSEIGEEIRTDLDKVGIHALGVLDFGYRQTTNNVRPINTPADLKGIVLRVMQSPIQIASWETLGATPVTMAVTEVFSALQTGTIQGQENPVNAICSNGFHEVQKYLSMTNHLFAPVMIAISNTAWNKLTDNQKEAFTKAMSFVQPNSVNVCAEYTDSGLETIKAAGVQINEVDRASFEEAIKPLHDQLNQQYDGALDKIKGMK